MSVRRTVSWLADSTIANYREHLKVLAQHCETVGRDFTSLQLSWLGRLSMARTEAEARERALALGYSHYKGWTFEKAFVGTSQQIVEAIGPFVEAGVSCFIFEMIGLPDPDVIGRVVEDVLAKVRKSHDAP